MSKRAVNKFVQNYVPENLKWSERSGLLTYINQLKYSEFSLDLDKEAEVVNFDMIHAKCRGDKQSLTDKDYQSCF